MKNKKPITLSRTLKDLDLLCSVCGKPEKSKYTPTPGRLFTCSSCVQIKLVISTQKNDNNNKLKRPIR